MNLNLCRGSHDFCCTLWSQFVSQAHFPLSALPSQGEVMTDMFYPIYPEGLYNAIKRCACRGFIPQLPQTTIILVIPSPFIHA